MLRGLGPPHQHRLPSQPPDRTIAVDPRVIPYGSKVMIGGVIYTAEDRGGGVKGNHVDIFFDTHSQTRQHGKQTQEVFLVLG